MRRRMRLRRVLGPGLGLALALLGGEPAGAVSLALSPSGTSFSVGQSLEVAIDISGLGAGVAPSLGVFDLDVAFDSAVLSFQGATYGDPALGDQLGLTFPSVTATTQGTGIVNLFGLSLDSAAALDAGQAGTFTLATLAFRATTPGASPVEFTGASLGDANGDPLQAALSGASISVRQGVVPVPEPGAFCVFLTGLAVLMAGLRRTPGR